MVDHFSLASGVPNQSIMAEYDARTDAVLARLVATLPPIAAQLLLGQPDEALAERELSWRNVLSGVEEATQDLPHPLPPARSRHHPGRWRWGRRAPPGPEALDDTGPRHRLRGHERAFRPAPDAMSRRAPGRACERLQELGMPTSITHGCGGAVMEPKEYVDLVRLRLGCTGPCEPVPCAACQNGSLDTGAAHATCCVVGRGPRVVTTRSPRWSQSCDSTAKMEVPWLSGRPHLCPGQLLHHP